MSPRLPVARRARGRRASREARPALPYRRGIGRVERGRRLLRAAQRMLATSALVAAAAMLGVLGGNSTYALWHDTRHFDAGALHPLGEGDVSLRFVVGDPLAGSAAFGGLLPGESQTLPVLLENDGALSLDLTAELVAGTNADYALGLAIDPACTASGYLSDPVIGGSAMTVGAPVPLGQLGAGQTATLCLQVTASNAISPESSAVFDVVLVGSLP